MRLKLRNTFVIPALIMVIVGIGIPMMVFHHHARKEITNLIYSQISQMAHSISLQLSLWIENNVLDMEDWASHGIYQLVLDEGSTLNSNISADAASTQLRQIRKNYSWYLSLSVAGMKGEIVVTSGDSGLGRNISEYEFFNAAQSGTSYVSETFKRTIDGRLIFVIASPVIKDGRVLGVIFGEIDMAYVDTHFIEPNKAGKTGYSFLFNRKTGSPVAHPDRTMLLSVNAEDYSWGQKLLGDTPKVVSYAYKGIHKLVAVNPVRLTQWTAAIGVPVEEILFPVKTSIYTVVVSGGVSIVVIAIAMWILTGQFVVKPVKRVVEFAEKLSQGDLSDRLPVKKGIKCSAIKTCDKTGCPFYDTGTYCMIGDDVVSDECLPCSPTGRQCLQCNKYKEKELNEFEEMAVSLNIFAEELNKKAVMASKIAKGDFSADIRVASEKDILGKALFMMIKAVNYSAQKLKESAERVANSADRVRGFSRRLSKGASDQNRALDKIKLGISDLEERANENTKSVALANELFDEAMGAADRGALQMMNMMAGMDAISESRNAIAKIINTIDGIAFQTNLLALNASVEAARAGKHGKGFGVVAQEVRNLASRCAQAARETAELIDNSVKKVADGSENAVKTASILEEIVENVSRVADIAKKVESMSDEQTLGLEQISIAIMKIEEITRQNAVTSDETSAAGEDLLYQAMEVQNLVKHYKLKQTERSGIPIIKESDGNHQKKVLTPTLNKKI